MYLCVCECECVCVSVCTCTCMCVCVCECVLVCEWGTSSVGIINWLLLNLNQLISLICRRPTHNTKLKFKQTHTCTCMNKEQTKRLNICTVHEELNSK